MNQDLRKLFEIEEDSKLVLPSTHKNEFIQKLELFNKRRPNQFLKVLIPIAASFILFFSIGYYNNMLLPKDSPIEKQLANIEQQYLIEIQEEWEIFIKLSNDEKLIDRYDKKLKELDANYQEISVKFKEDLNNILILETLIINLQTRLKLLKDIKQHVILINKELELHENTSV